MGQGMSLNLLIYFGSRTKLCSGIAAIGLAVLSACANVPPEQIPVDFDFGPIPEDVQSKTEAHFATILKDPDSARYAFDEEFIQVACHTFELRGTPRKLKYAGWARKVGVNAKNSYGGYTGATRYAVLFQDEKIWKVLDAGDFAMEGCNVIQ